VSAPRTLVVTGASRGLGRHIALKAQQAGYAVVGLARNIDPDLPFEMHSCDVSDRQAVKDTFKNLRRESELYALVNAAGIASMNLVVTTPTETMQRIVEVNLLGTMYCSAAMGKLLARRGTGRIINFSTIAVALGLKGEAVYAGSKAGVEGFSRAFAREMADFSITVNTVAPGPILTDLIKNVPSEKIEAIVNQQVLPKMATPDDVWDILSFLLSDESKMLSGQVLNVGGA
jgi:3-oxoacyl-[acyl-carrier protein] reductase